MSSASGTQPQTAVRGGPSAAAVLQVSAEATRRLPGTEVDEVLEFVTGRTLEVTGADLVVLALPGEGHPAADNQARRRERRRPTPVTECDSVIGPTSRGSPTRSGCRIG
jgi:hypothetical protein